MKFSSKVRYGTRALLELALRWGEGPVPLKDIARRQQIPLPYLEHLICPLVQAGLIKSARGTRGGVTLLKPPGEIILSEVIDLLEGPGNAAEYGDRALECHDYSAAYDVWDEVTEQVNRVFESITLQSLVERQQLKSRVG